jgi:hypothetical protein
VLIRATSMVCLVPTTSAEGTHSLGSPDTDHVRRHKREKAVGNPYPYHTWLSLSEQESFMRFLETGF